MKAKLLGLFAVLMLLFTACDSGSSTTAQKPAETPVVETEAAKPAEEAPAETAKPAEEAPASTEAKPAS